MPNRRVSPLPMLIGAVAAMALSGCTSPDVAKDESASGPACAVDSPVSAAAPPAPVLLSQVAGSVTVDGVRRVSTIGAVPNAPDTAPLWTGGSTGSGGFVITGVDPVTATTVAEVPATGQPFALQVRAAADRTVVAYLDFTNRRPVQTTIETGETVTGPAFPESASGLTLNPSGTRGYVPLSLDGDIAVVDLASGSLVCLLPLVGGPAGPVVLADDGVRAFVGFVVNGGSAYRSGIEVLDRGTGATLAVWDAPTLVDLDLSPDQSLLAGASNSSVVILDATTGEIRAEATAIGDLDGATWDPSGAYVYAWSYLDSTVWVIEAASGAVRDTIDLPGQPSQVLITEGRGYVADGPITLLAP